MNASERARELYEELGELDAVEVVKELLAYIIHDGTACSIRAAERLEQTYVGERKAEKLNMIRTSGVSLHECSPEGHLRKALGHIACVAKG